MYPNPFAKPRKRLLVVQTDFSHPSKEFLDSEQVRPLSSRPNNTFAPVEKRDKVLPLLRVQHGIESSLSTFISADIVLICHLNPKRMAKYSSGKLLGSLLLVDKGPQRFHEVCIIGAVSVPWEKSVSNTAH